MVFAENVLVGGEDDFGAVGQRRVVEEATKST